MKHELHLLNTKFLITCITFSFGSIGLINAGRNNLANIISKNLDNYKLVLKNSAAIRMHERVLRRMRQDLYVYSRTTFFLGVCFISAFLQIIVTAYSDSIEYNLIGFSKADYFDITEGFMFCLSLVGIVLNIVGVAIVMTNKRQNPFKGLWSPV